MELIPQPFSRLCDIKLYTEAHRKPMGHKWITHGGLNKMTINFQVTVSNTLFYHFETAEKLAPILYMALTNSLYCMNIVGLWVRFHRNLILMFQLQMNPHRLRHSMEPYANHIQNSLLHVPTGRSVQYACTLNVTHHSVAITGPLCHEYLTSYSSETCEKYPTFCKNNQL